jgi:hypothetical protein
MPALFGKEWPPKSLVDHAAYWEEECPEKIKKIHEYCQNGYYEKEGLGVHVGYSVIGSDYADRAFSLYVLGKDYAEIMLEMKQAIAYKLKALDVLKNPENPEYNKKYDVRDGYGYTETMKNIYYSVLGDDISAAKIFAGGKWIVVNPIDGGYADGLTQTRNNEPIPIFLKGLSQFILGNPDGAIETITPLMQNIEKRGLSKKWSLRKDYYTLMRALYGIIKHDEEKVNSGIAMQLELAEHAGANPHSEDYCLPDYFICQDATVLAILALREGININIEHALLPKMFLGAS